MKTSKITVYKPNGRTWTNSKGGTMYSIDIELENGDKGTCNSTKPEGSLSVGTEVTYDVETRGQYTDIKNIKKVEAFVKGGGKGGSYLDDPKVLKAKFTAYSYTAAINFLSMYPPAPDEPDETCSYLEDITADHIHALAKKTYKWITDNVQDNSVKWNRANAIVEASRCIKFLAIGIDSFAKLSSFAETIYANIAE